jgi:hypothetical protein
MAFSFSRTFNKGGKFDIDTTGFEYASMADLFAQNGADKVYPLTAVYINHKSQFGDAPVFASVGFFVNAPKHMLDTANDILSSPDAIDAINGHHVGFSIRQYTQKTYNRVCYSIDFIDVEW